MSTKHYVLFIGASASLSSELHSLEGRIANSKIISPAAGKKFVGVSQQTVDVAVKALFSLLAGDGNQLETARFSIWLYGPPAADQLKILWEAFGRSAWIEFVPLDLMHKNSPTKIFIERRLKVVLSLMHVVSQAVYSGRKTSPLPLPLRNFRSDLSDELRRFWYRGLDEAYLKATIERLYQKFRQRRVDGQKKYEDDRNVIFEPAGDAVCHGQPHPTGVGSEQFIAGRFRFGVSIFKGFHYEVSSAKHSTLRSTLTDGDSGQRDMTPERRRYINIFPNDHLLPTK
ncbi:hypothetical protein U1839_03760 [Sphingomonas sp. RT2P30]|uniref:hypothetical protein n=1 Tax=Parasphingomonas halimpatiens TaxID=3096162 RepID=UPI002FCA8A1B